MERPSKQVKHRNTIKGYFITFTKSGEVTKQKFYDAFSSVFGVDKAIVGVEPHKDGNPHIHMAVILKEPKTKSQILSYLRTSYPNDYKRIDVESLVSFPSSITYLTTPEKEKEVDPDPLLINCEITQQTNYKHNLIHHELRESPIEQRWYTCYCRNCEPQYLNYRNSLINDIFGEDPRINRPTYKN